MTSPISNAFEIAFIISSSSRKPASAFAVCIPSLHLIDIAKRFTNEANRLYGVMNNRLFDRSYLVGNQYTIADMISYPWCVVVKNQEQNISDFVYLNRWFNELSERPAVKRVMKIGSIFSKDSMLLSDEELKRRSSILYNQRARLAPEGGLL